MGRPSLGASGRTLTRTVKITAYEDAMLRKRCGTSYAGMRAALDAFLALPVGVAHTQDVLTVRCTRHPAFEEVVRYTDRGVDYVVEQCTVCGFQATREA